MGEIPSESTSERDGSGATSDRDPGYEPPRLTVMGTFEELTQLKIAGSSDFVNFQPSHP